MTNTEQTRPTMFLDRKKTLADGTRVRLRFPQARDRAQLAALHAHLGLEVGELELARLLSFDPRRRFVLCATTWDGTHERLLGYGAIDRTTREQDVLVGDERGAGDVAELLARTLAEVVGARSAA